MELQPFDPWPIAIVALLNPITAVMAFVMGRHANQWQKIIVAAFAAALAGYVGVWVATYFGLLPIKGVGAATGVFILQFVFGLVWAIVGYVLFRVPQPVDPAQS
ncbi:MAG: hypothetical protein AAFO75_04200 [Pseudomonadota bacterium]